MIEHATTDPAHVPPDPLPPVGDSRYGWDTRAVAPGIDDAAVRAFATDAGYMAPATGLEHFATLAFAAAYDAVTARQLGYPLTNTPEDMAADRPDNLRAALALGYAFAARLADLTRTPDDPPPDPRPSQASRLNVPPTPEPEASPAVRLARAVLLFHGGGPWTAADGDEWERVTGSREATTKVLGDLARRVAGEVTP